MRLRTRPGLKRSAAVGLLALGLAGGVSGCSDRAGMAATTGAAGASSSGASSDGGSGLLGGAAAGGGSAGIATGGSAGTAGSVSRVASDFTRLDNLVFGNADSETKHTLTTGFFPVQAVVSPLPSEPSSGAASDVVTGALGLSGRRLLPRTPTGDYYGGEVSFTMAVDPNEQNYFTAKLWGDEQSDSWLVLDVEGLEVGARHAYGDGSNNEMIFGSSFGWLPKRFLYRTERIPKHLTAGKTSIKVKLRSLGTLQYYAGGNFDHAQSRMSAPTVALYQASTHRGAFFEPDGEMQGAAPAINPGKAPTATEEATMLKNWKDKVNARIADRLATVPSTLTSDDVQFLAEAYGVSWSSAYQKAAVVDQLRATIDALVTAYAADPMTFLSQSYPANAGWGGYFGPIGEAIHLTWPALSASLTATVAYGGTIGSVTRRAGWAKALRASVDFGRFDRKLITNQQMDNAWRTYAANRGLLLVDAPSALNEDEAKRYLYEAVGLAPWLGNDKPGTGATPVRGDAPFGPNWYTVTTRGTTKEEALVGGDYGERGSQLFDWFRRTGDAKLLPQAAKMLSARAALRHFVADKDGKQIAYAVEQIGCRNFQEVDSHLVYLGRGGAPDVASASAGAALNGKEVVGYLQQQFNDGQLLRTLSGIPANYWSGAAYLPDDYQAFRAEPGAGVVLPMTPGQPDFGWADEENLVIAAQHGDERIWATLNWRSTNYINGLVRVYVETPTTSWLGEVANTDVVFNPSGKNATASGSVEGNADWTPPDKPMNAEAGVMYPIALRPDLTQAPATNRDGGRGTGYTLRYGHWLVAINAHPNMPYAMPTPTGFVGSVDLVSGKPLAAPVKLPPKSAVVFHLD
jgi:hypothetical protein